MMTDEFFFFAENDDWWVGWRKTKDSHEAFWNKAVCKKGLRLMLPMVWDFDP